MLVEGLNFPSGTPVQFVQELCRSGTYQTLSARILGVSYISDKPVRFWQIRHFVQIQTFLARFLRVKLFLERFLYGLDFPVFRHCPARFVQEFCKNLVKNGTFCLSVVCISKKCLIGQESVRFV